LIIRAVGRAQTTEDIANLPVKFGAGVKPIVVKDVAEVGIGARTWHVGRGLHNEYAPWNRGFETFLGYYGAFGTYINPKLTRPPGVETVVARYLGCYGKRKGDKLEPSYGGCYE
jgi:hypothetical protein